jgi:hypothetical protein
MRPGFPPTLPGQILDELDRNGGQITSLFDLAYRRLDCSYWWLCQTVDRMEASGDIQIIRRGKGRATTIEIPGGHNG